MPSVMPSVRANGIQIEYDTFGDDSSPPLLLIMGFGGQMILWDREFCRQLAEAGLHVIRFDNRDVGLSSKLDDLGVPDLGEMFSAARRVEEIEVPYTLEDMGDDAIGLLDGLGVEKAHVCGASMGGMIAQIMAIRHPDRVSSLVSMASTTGDPEVASVTSEAVDSPAIPHVSVPRERESNIEYTVKGMRELAGAGIAFDEERARRVAAELYDRCFCPEGAARQFLALLASGNRKPALAKLTLPTLVIHGDRDPLVPVEHGRDTARAVPGADLLIIEGMGHNLPREAWPRIVAAIAAHAAGARERTYRV
jgi:pimeloyl-ACP methyl ester carboxylesterase